MTTKETVDYFIRKFRKIPKNKWAIGSLEIEGRFCALGHCGQRDGVIAEQSQLLNNLFLKELEFAVPFVNDGHHGKYNLGHPKLNILAALKDIKEGL